MSWDSAERWFRGSASRETKDMLAKHIIKAFGLTESEVRRLAAKTGTARATPLNMAIRIGHDRQDDFPRLIVSDVKSYAEAEKIAVASVSSATDDDLGLRNEMVNVYRTAGARRLHALVLVKVDRKGGRAPTIRIPIPCVVRRTADGEYMSVDMDAGEYLGWACWTPPAVKEKEAVK